MAAAATTSVRRGAFPGVEGRFRTTFRDASLRAQVVLMFGSVAIVSAALTWTIVVASVGVGLDGADTAAAERVRGALAVGIALVLAGTGVAILGAAAFLRSSIGRTIMCMQQATAAIADGDFAHRIGAGRRDEFGQLADSIDAMAERLHELESSRQRLIASVSHELRTPLTVIRGHAFTLGRGEHDSRRRQRFELIDGEVERLARLIDDLLTAATLRAAPVRLQRERHELGTLLASAGERFTLAARRAGIELSIRVPGGIGVVVDARRIDQVVGNLLSNAIAHAPAGGHVELVAAPVGGEGQQVRVHVRNDGDPIPQPLQERIFEPFVQGERPTGSVGLGLSIAHDLVAAHGSELHVRSGDGGTDFWFELQQAAAVKRAARAVATARYATT